MAQHPHAGGLGTLLWYYQHTDSRVTISPTVEFTFNAHEDIMGYYTKQTGAVYEEHIYDVWGGVRWSTGHGVNDGKTLVIEPNYTGHSYDPILKIYHAEARFYDGKTRQWMASDPIKSGLNWYQYVESNPTTFVDPTGLIAVIGEDENGNLIFDTPRGREEIRRLENLPDKDKIAQRPKPSADYGMFETSNNNKISYQPITKDSEFVKRTQGVTQGKELDTIWARQDTERLEKYSNAAFPYIPKSDSKNYEKYLEEDANYKFSVLKETYKQLYRKQGNKENYAGYLYGEWDDKNKYHQGVDFTGGNEVYALGDSIVVGKFARIACEEDKSAGNRVAINDGYTALVLRSYVTTSAGSGWVDVYYMHLDVLPGFNDGDIVKKGTKIGYENSKYSVDKHTHLEVLPTDVWGARLQAKTASANTYALNPYEIYESLLFGSSFGDINFMASKQGFNPVKDVQDQIKSGK